MIKVRAMECEDVECVSEIEAQVFSMPWKADDFIEMIEAPYAYYYVALYDGNIIGTAGLRNIAGEGEITNVAVQKEYRRMGVADALMIRVLQEGTTLGIMDYTLEVRESNKAAVALYGKYGFVVEGIRKDFYDKPTESALIMWKR